MKLTSLPEESHHTTAYKCPCCGQTYDELPLCFGSDKPDYYYAIPTDEREKRIELKESLCVVDEEHFFHRCRLIIPIIDYPEDLIFNVWASISEDNFWIRMDLWGNPNRTQQNPYFGWLQTLVPTYGETLNIKTLAFEQEVGHIPHIKVVEENHALTIDQEKGITYEKALDIVDKILSEAHS
ncbi:MAG: DUF2199 domain-containing protein [Saprospiraceae bacterium]|nr:DUF2199 domain-containing protein [Saprospiraceae bacterium]